MNPLRQPVALPTLLRHLRPLRFVDYLGSEGRVVKLPALVIRPGGLSGAAKGITLESGTALVALQSIN
jgi:hypothetical protein